MNHFVAPQFIDVEDRIIGPITTRQFILMIIVGIIIFVSYKLLDQSSFVLVTFVGTVYVLVVGFVKINGRHFVPYMKSMIETLRRSRVRVWCKLKPTKETMKRESQLKKDIKSQLPARKKNISARHLKEIALFVDTGGRFTG